MSSVRGSRKELGLVNGAGAVVGAVALALLLASCASIDAPSPAATVAALI